MGYGLLRGLGQGAAQFGDRMVVNELDKMKEQRLQRFQQSMQDRQFSHQEQMQDRQFGQQDTIQQRQFDHQAGLLRRQRDWSLDDQDRQDGQAAHWFNRPGDEGMMEQVGVSRTGEEIASLNAGPAPRERPNTQLVTKGDPAYGEETYYTYDPATNTMTPVNMAGGGGGVVPQEYDGMPWREAVSSLAGANNLSEQEAERILLIQHLYELGAGAGAGAGGGDQDGPAIQQDDQNLPEGYEIEPTLMMQARSGVSRAARIIAPPESVQSETQLMQDASDVSAVRRVKGLLEQGMLPRSRKEAQRALDSGQLTPQEEQVLRQYLGQ